MHTKKNAAIALARKTRLLRARDFDRAGIPRSYLARLRDEGILLHLGRGLYQYAEAELSSNQSLAEASKRVPHGVISLLSALRFHDLTTQSPSEVWMTIGPKARTPAPGSPRLQIVRASGEALTAGVEHQDVQGVCVPIYGPAKTVADCFKYRSRVGLDVAIEALRDGWQQRRASADELWRYAKICRVANVMRPYMESLS
jgi:predicted transcriptional regulator of viral defense system